MEMDMTLYEKCSREYNDKQKKLDTEREQSEIKWKAITDAATKNGIDVNALLS